MTVLGLTGVYAGGKSAAAEYFRRLGCDVFSADDSARQTLKKNSAVYKKFVKTFGPDCLTAKGDIDRVKLGNMVFSDKASLNKLTAMIHPEVRKDCLVWISKHKKNKSIGVLEVPLLFEAGFDDLCDYTLAVVASKNILMSRARIRGVQKNKFENILRNQWPAAKKATKADFVIRNNGSLSDLKIKVREIFNQLNNKTGVQGI